MALQSSGAISLSQVQGEFGGSNPISINEYYGRATGIPGSGRISLSDFYGKSNYVPLRILGHTQIGSRAGNVGVPSGTRSVIVMGGVGTNRGYRTKFTSASIGGVGMREVISRNYDSEYSFDSVIYVVNYSSPGTRYVILNVSSALPYGAETKVIFLNKAFNNYSPSSVGSARSTGTVNIGGMTTYGEGIQVGAATVRNDQTRRIGTLSSFTGFKGVVSTSFVQWSGQTSVNGGGGGRDSHFAWQTSGGAYNSASTQQTFQAQGLFNDYGETFVAATWAPTRFV